MKFILVVSTLVVALVVLGYVALQLSWHGDTPGHYYGASIVEHFKHKSEVLKCSRFFSH
ncbi:hypothetical protein M9194_11185 [Vibrio sp. S4M6]|uniref:hypothetical protein n=1 Tax=Vibrio sinus TaxID=2946865 RepID=UPI00202A2433|nr:hypothetical protein [Vibrio sinus]MCL9781988.1 hypothetical protein [Vibrio sinus]